MALHGGVESKEPEEQQAAQGHLCGHFDFSSDRAGFKGAPSARPWQRLIPPTLFTSQRESETFALPGVWTPAGPWPGPRVKLRNGRSSIRMSFEAESHGDTATESGSRVLQGLPDGSFPCSLCQNATSWQILCTPRVPRMKWKAWRFGTSWIPTKSSLSQSCYIKVRSGEILCWGLWSALRKGSKVLFGVKN